MNWQMETQNEYDFQNQVLNTSQTAKERLLYSKSPRKSLVGVKNRPASPLTPTVLTSHLANPIALCVSHWIFSFLQSLVPKVFSWTYALFLQLLGFVVGCFVVFFLFPEAKSCISIVQKIGNRFVLLKCVGSLNGNWEEKEGTACSPVTFFPLIHMDTRKKSDSYPLKQ